MCQSQLSVTGIRRLWVFTGALAVDLDERQYDLGFGPCLDAAKTGQTIVVDTDAVDSPYNEFARIAARAGIRHVVSVGLPLDQRSIGGVNIYCTTDGPLTPEFVQHAEVFASYAAVAVNNVTRYADVADEAATCGQRWRRGRSSSKPTASSWPATMAPPRRRSTFSGASPRQNAKLRDLAQLVDSVKQ